MILFATQREIHPACRMDLTVGRFVRLHWEFDSVLCIHAMVDFVRTKS
jgi:hypothetical protein